MDMQKTIREIGMFETAVNLAKVSGSAGELSICQTPPLYVIPSTALYYCKYFEKRQ